MSLKQRVESEHVWSSDMLPVVIEQWCVLITIVIFYFSLYSPHVFSSCVHICFGPNLYFSHWRILGHICRWMFAIAVTWEPIIITHVTANMSDKKYPDCISLFPPPTLLSSLHHLSFHQPPPPSYGTRYNLPIWCCILKGSSRIKFIEFSWKVFHRNQKSNGEVKGLEKR